MLHQSLTRFISGILPIDRRDMNIRIKRLDRSLPLPEYETAGAAGFDIYTSIDATILPGEIVKLPTNLVIETPSTHMLMMAARSSLPGKVGLALANSVAVFDSDFCGDGDEMLIQVYNFTKQPVSVTRGQKLAQGVFVRIDIANWKEAEMMGNPDRGGIGSTDRIK